MIIPGALTQVIGIDPGRHGALAMLRRHERPVLVDMPVHPGHAGINHESITAWLTRWMMPGTVVMIEAAIMIRGKNGCGTGFNVYPREQGALVGIAHAVAFLQAGGKATVEECQPAAWKAVYGLHGRGKVGAGEYLLGKGLATKEELIPKGCRVPHDGRSDALLIAMYGALLGGWNVIQPRK